ncbi:NAD(P)/FAD-dependent oxidoreductase [Fibrella forsythiae]|uniref:NAD(P)/FAD-dependent oxidoreductase n=1 Tax=Fibrella forsythiae TaxID=2817061 RepID=A0ABS3JRA9_9BACT|nr:NAD(P)/FAD-dependent oxidoreductase [Fibrella forsythiae]MBO0952548.1 NAD(P)/FAD-dependent oxidoreductase [Fibrella forsythiae]
MNVNQPYDVIIVGGSNAGLSAAMLLGRSLRRVLVIDAGKPCNRQTLHSHGFLTRNAETPTQLLAVARKQVSYYPSIQFWSDTVVSATQTPNGFTVTTADGVVFSSRKLLLATGVADIMPNLPGFAECWGRSVLHCHYCHGYEVHSQPLGVLANGEMGYEMATLIQHWTNQLTLYTNGPSTLTDAQRQTLVQLQIPLIETPLKAIEHDAGQLTALLFTDQTRAYPIAIFSRVLFGHHTNIAAQLGCVLTETNFVQATEFGETNVPGLVAAGDITTPFRQVAVAVANGSKAAAWINRELLTEDLKRRVQVTGA